MKKTILVSVIALLAIGIAVFVRLQSADENTDVEQTFIDEPTPEADVGSGSAVNFVNELLGIPSCNEFNASDIMGRQVQEWSDSHLPLWLSDGIEALILNEQGLYSPIYTHATEDFGDLRFLPVIRGRTSQNHATDTALLFVSYLHENGLLLELLDLYTGTHTNDSVELYTDELTIFDMRQRMFIPLPDRNLSQANAKAQELYSNFSGLTMDLSYGLFLNESGGYFLETFVGQNRYIFSFDSLDEYIPLERLQDITNTIETASELVINWYSQWSSFEIEPVTSVLFYAYGSFALAEGTNAAADVPVLSNIVRFRRIGVDNEDFYILATHEYSHIVEGWIGGRVDFSPFSEGLATLLGEIVNGYNINSMHDGVAAFIQFVSLGVDTFHLRSILDYTEDNLHYFPILDDYERVASFVCYLISLNGVEAYLQVHWDIDNFENIYGMSLHEKVEEWMDFMIEYSFLGPRLRNLCN